MDAARGLQALAWALLGGLGFISVSADTQAQAIQLWTYQSVLGESSAAVGMDDQYMFVADNEDETLRLYARYPDTACAAPVYEFNARPYLNLSSSNPEADLEAAVKLTDAGGTRIYWLGSHSNSKSGNLRPNRLRLFATQVSGTGVGPAPYSLTYVGRYDQLRTDLIAWDQNGLHGKGANYFGLAACAAAGVASGRIDAFNLEGLVMAPNGSTAYLAFRAPLVNSSGPSTALGPRTHALLVPLLNMPALVSGSSSSTPGRAGFGPPCLLDLGGRGVRSIDSSYPGHYLITAGPPGDASNPPVAPLNFRLFTWTGRPEDAPVEQATEIPAGLSPEGAIIALGPIEAGTIVQFVSDDGGVCWRGFTAAIIPQPPVVPRLEITHAGGNVIVSWTAAPMSAGFRLQHSVDLGLLGRTWVDNPTGPVLYGANQGVTEPADGVRFYRLIKP